MNNHTYEDIGRGRIYHGDCLEIMKEIPDGVVDMILCDLPYGTTQCSWDSIIPFDKLWEIYWRVLKQTGAIVLTCAQPFTANLIASQLQYFRYELIWDKVNKYTGALSANRKPLRRHENIAVFYRKQCTYNKQLREGRSYVARRTKGHGEYCGNRCNDQIRHTINDGHHNPCSIIEIKGDNKKEGGLHPTQKPVELFEYLIRTYSNENNLILDNCAGSGTTAIAAINTNRRWVCIEKDETYFQTAHKRICSHLEGNK